MSRLALGTMAWGAGTPIEDARDHLKTYLTAGGDFVDTAYGYGDGASEEALGAMLGDLVPREDLIICTKAGISRRTGTRVVDTSRRTLMHQLETSLQRIGTPYVDLWLVHTWSDDTPPRRDPVGAGVGRDQRAGTLCRDLELLGVAGGARRNLDVSKPNPPGSKRDRVLAPQPVT